MLADRWGRLCWEIPPGGPARSAWYVRLGFRDIECLIDRYLLTQCKRDQTDGEKGKQDKHAPRRCALMNGLVCLFIFVFLELTTSRAVRAYVSSCVFTAKILSMSMSHFGTSIPLLDFHGHVRAWRPEIFAHTRLWSDSGAVATDARGSGPDSR